MPRPSAGSSTETLSTYKREGRMKDIFEGAGVPLDQPGFNAALDLVGGDPEALWSILQVETRGFGFFDDRRPKILYERHIFHARTGGRFDATATDLSNEQ